MPAILSPNAKQQFFTDGSTVAAGYKLHTYAANTTTNQATFTDRAGSVPNDNPITLDARGEAIIYLTPGVVYDYVLKTGTGTTVWTREDVIADAGDANAVTFTQAGTGAVTMSVQAKLRGLDIDATDFGVVADGVTVCDTQMAAAIAATPTGCRLRLPRGTVKLNNTLSAANVEIVGGGWGSVLDFSGLSAGEDAVVFGPSFTAPPTMRRVKISMNAAGRDGIVFQGADHPTLEDVQVHRPGRDGIVLEPSGAFMWIENTRFKNTKVIEPIRDGLRMTLGNFSDAFINLGVYDGFEVRDAARYVLNVEQGHVSDSINQHTFIGCELEQNRNMPADPLVYFNRTNASHPTPFASQFVFINCTFEDLSFAHTGGAIDSNVFATGIDEVTLINCIVFNYAATFGTGIRRGYELTTQSSSLRGERPFHVAASTAGAINDALGGLAMEGYNSTGLRKRYATVDGIIADSSNGSEDGKIRASVLSNGTPQPSFDSDFPTTASDTAFIVAVNRAGVTTLSRVTIGAADSAGAGFRQLRVPNA